MPTLSPPASLLCVLLCMSVALQRSDLQVAYVTQSSFFYYSCSQEPQPCSTTSLTDCCCKDVPLAALHRSQSYSSPVFRMRHLTVWFTSPANTARLLNNSEVRHLKLIYCGTEGTANISPDKYFAVQHLERLTLVNRPHRPVHPSPDANNAKTTDSNMDTETDNSAHLDTNRLHRDLDSNLDLLMDLKRDALNFPPTQIQDLFLGRELGAAHQEQARLGIIHSSVMEWGAEVKAYTIQTQIDSDGTLPFPDLHLPKLPETSVIYVSFVY